MWTVPSMQRVGKTDPAGTATQAQIYAAQGEYESYQIVVRAPATGLTGVNVQVSALQGPTTIPTTASTLYREQYVNVSPSSPNWGGSNQPGAPGMYPDGLIPFVNPVTGASLYNSSAHIRAVPFNLKANTNQPIWVDVRVPDNAPAGQYTGTYTVTSTQGNVTGHVLLTVWNFRLPASPYLRSSFSYWQADSLAAEQELLRNRLDPGKVSTANEDTLMSGYGLNATATGYWSGADVSNCSMSPAPSVSQFQTAISGQAPGLYLYDYSADEINNCTNLYPSIQQWAYNMHQVGLRNLITMVPVSALFSDGSGSGRSAVDIWTVLPFQYHTNQAIIGQALAKGDEVWSYNALVQDSYSPKWEIDFSPANYRIQAGFLSQTLALTGLLYWRIDNWSANPWTNVNNTGTFSTNNYPGEGMLVYPGQQVGIPGVAPSLRLKYLRDGVDDYDYVQLLKNAGQGAWALQTINGVAASFVNWSQDPNAIQAVRLQLGQKLHELFSPPGAPASPSPASGTTGVPVNPTLSWSGSAGATSYSVYFGTTKTPPLTATSTVTSWAPGTLDSGVAYYWKVAANGSGGTTASPVWSFVTAAALPAGASPYSVFPSSGSTLTQTFQFVFYDSKGFFDLAGGGVLMNNSLSGANACWIYYDRAGNTVSLASNDASAWSYLALGSGNTLNNNQCSINGASTSVTLLGNYAYLTMAINFNASFAGTRTIYMYAVDNGGTVSSYQSLGSWNVP